MPPTRIPRPLASTLDAIDVVLTVLDEEPTTTLAALLDHPAAGGGVVVLVDGGDPGPHGAELLAATLGGAVPRPGHRLVLVSVRDTGGDAPREADLAAWRRLVERHRAADLALLDWLVVTHDAILSLAELAGPAPRWGPRPSGGVDR